MGAISLYREIRKREHQLFLQRGDVFPRKPLVWSVYATMFLNPQVLQFRVGVGNVAAWYVKQLTSARQGQTLYVVAGEMSFALTRSPVPVFSEKVRRGPSVKGDETSFDSETMDVFTEALQAGTNIVVIAGPQLAVREADPQAGNPITKLLAYKGLEGCGRFRLFLIPIGIQKPSHFAIFGHSVFIEEPHIAGDPPEKIRGKGIENSVFWLNHLVARYQDLIDQQPVVEIKEDSLHLLAEPERQLRMTDEELTPASVRALARQEG